MTQQRVNVVSERRARTSQAQLQPADVLDAPLQRASALGDADALLDMGEAAERLRFKAPRAADKCRQLLQRNHVTLHRVGRRFLVRRDVLDRFVETGASGLDAQALAAVAQLTRPVTNATVSRPVSQAKEMEL